MTKTYRKLCFYDKKQTRLKMAHVVSCRFIYKNGTTKDSTVFTS